MKQQRWEESEKRKGEERRAEKKKNQKKKTQGGRKVEKSQNICIVFFPNA